MPKKEGYKDIIIKDKSGIVPLEDMINTWHDPDLIYYYVKQMEQNCKTGLTLKDIPKEKRLMVDIYCKLEVFRATMQYLEEFGIYLLSYIDNPKDIVRKLVSTRPGNVETFFKLLKDGKHDEFSQTKRSIGYRELLKEVFAYDIVPKLTLCTDKFPKEEIPQKIEESIDFFEKRIDYFAEFYLNFLDLYNAIKHGTRVFPHKTGSIKITGPKNHEGYLGQDYVTAICKDKAGNPYLLEYPIEYLIDNSVRITEQLHTVFSYLRRIAIHRIKKPEKINLTFFKSIPDTEPKTEYVKVWNSNATIVIPKPAEMEEHIDQPLKRKFAFNLILNRKNLILHTKYDEETSPDYPLLIEATFIPQTDLKPRIEKMDFKFTFNIFNVDVQQYLDLLKMYELSGGDEIERVQIFDDLRNEKLGPKAEVSNLNFPEIPLVQEKNLIEFLSKLQLIAGKKIPVPLGLSPIQESIINENISKKLTKVDAGEILTDLQDKSNKAKYITIFVEKLDPKGNIIYSKRLGGVYGAPNFNFNFKDSKEEKRFKEEVLENPKMFIQEVIKGVDGDSDKLIREFELFANDPVNNTYPKIITDPKLKNTNHNPKFDITFKYNFGEPTFWHQEYFIKITINLLK